MKLAKQRFETRSQNGSLAALAFVGMVPLLIAIGAFAVDTQNFQSSRAELQRACDAGALAGANLLYKYGTSPTTAQADIITRATTVTGLNESSGRSVANDTDSKTLTNVTVDVQPPAAGAPKALPPVPAFGGTVRVSATMRVASLFAPIIKFGFQDVRAQGTAGPSGQANTALSRALWPSVISLTNPDPLKVSLEKLEIGDTIQFEYQNPDGSSAAWTALEKYPGGNTNVNDIRDRMDQYRNPKASGIGHQPIKVGDEISVSNGNMETLYDKVKTDFSDKEVIVPVTESQLGPGDTKAKVIGFIAVTIKSVSKKDNAITMQLNRRGIFNGTQDGTGKPWDGTTHDTFFSEYSVLPVKLLQ